MSIGIELRNSADQKKFGNNIELDNITDKMKSQCFNVGSNQLTLHWVFR